MKTEVKRMLFGIALLCMAGVGLSSGVLFILTVLSRGFHWHLLFVPVVASSMYVIASGLRVYINDVRDTRFWDVLIDE